MPFAPIPFDKLPPAGRQLRIRREAEKSNLRAIKTRWRSGTPDNLGGWQIIDPRGRIAAGKNYSLSDDDALAFLQSVPAKARRP